MRILCLHGFLGSPKDFDFLKDDFEVIAPDLGDLVCLSFEELSAEIEKIFNPLDDIILGYSFGSRLGARLFHHFDMNTKLICLAGHLGLRPDQKAQRVKIENKFMSQLNTLSEKEFLIWWNSLDLFKEDADLKVANFKNAMFYFENYCLSKQPNLTKVLENKKDKISFNYGAFDKKYCEYAKNNLESYNVNFLDGVGHRIIQHQSIVKDLIKKELM